MSGCVRLEDYLSNAKDNVCSPFPLFRKFHASLLSLCFPFFSPIAHLTRAPFPLNQPTKNPNPHIKNPISLSSPDLPITLPSHQLHPQSFLQKLYTRKGKNPASSFPRNPLLYLTKNITYPASPSHFLLPSALRKKKTKRQPKKRKIKKIEKQKAKGASPPTPRITSRRSSSINSYQPVLPLAQTDATQPQPQLPLFNILQNEAFKKR